MPRANLYNVCLLLVSLFLTRASFGANEVPFLTEDAPLDSLARAFGFRINNEFHSGRIILSSNKHEIILSAGLDRALVDGRGYPLLSSPHFVGGTMAVPPDLADLVRRFGTSSLDVENINRRRKERKIPFKTALLPPVMDLSPVLGAKSKISTKTHYDGFILIDAGHGGSDVGAIGANKTQEKNVVLPLALSLAKYLKAKNIRVVLTRTKDKYISPYGRAKMAAKLKPDFVVSIHANSYSREYVSGVESWVISPKLIKNKLVAKNSRKLGTIIQKALVKSTGSTDRGVREGLFTILRYSSVPAVIVEIGFISNKTEEKNMLSSKWRNNLAKALSKACINSGLLKKHAKPVSSAK